MCTLAQKITNIINTIINNKPMNNNTHSNNKVTVMTSLINVLFNSNNPSYQADNEVDVMSNSIQYTNEYDVDLYISGDYGHSTDTEEQQVADMEAAFEAEIDALYADDSVPMSLPSDMMAMIMAAAANAHINNVNSDVNEEDAMCNDNCPVCENGVSTNMLCSACEETMLNESYVDKHGSDMEDDMSNDKDNMFSIMPVLALASANMTQERIMVLVALVAMIVAIIATFVAIFWYEKKQKANKLAILNRKQRAEEEQDRCFYAMVEMERRERNIAFYRQQALDEAERIAQLERDAVLREEYRLAAEREQEREAQRLARNAEILREMEERRLATLKVQAELGCKHSAEKWKYEHFIRSIVNTTDINALWAMFDTELEEEITFEAFNEAEKNLNESADCSFFYKNASIQGLRSYWLMYANLDSNSHHAACYNAMACKFSEFGRQLEKAMRNSDNEYYEFIRQASWETGYSWQALRILTKTEWEAAKLIISKKNMQFFSRWQLPLNDAATGGLLLAMSKDSAFADEMHAMKDDREFWQNRQMNAEKSLWKAAQWKTYLARYNKVKELKEDLMPIFASEEVATCKLTTDIVVGFNFNKKEFESCDVANTEQIEKILAAGYDQVLRIRRTDAKGIWEESQQINGKYTGRFCTGNGSVQSEGYYQGSFLNGTNIPWVADIQISGEWDNFGVILTNSIGVVDFGMGNDNRSKKHRPILVRMFGDADQATSKTPGQLEAIKMYNTWFIQREFNINHVVAQIKANLAAAINSDVW